MRVASVGLAVIVAGCTAVHSTAPPVWEGTEECFVRLMEPIRLRMRYKDFNHTYRNALIGSVSVPLNGSMPGTLVFLKSNGGFCGTLRRGGGVTGPQDLEVYSRAAKVVM